MAKMSIDELKAQIRDMQLEMARKDLLSISNLEQVVALQKDRDRYLRMVRKIAKATAKELFALQRRAQRMLEKE